MLYSGETSLIFMSYRYRNLKKIVEKKLRHTLHYFVLSKQSKYLLALDSFLKKLGWEDLEVHTTNPPEKTKGYRCTVELTVRGFCSS